VATVLAVVDELSAALGYGGVFFTHAFSAGKATRPFLGLEVSKAFTFTAKFSSEF